MIVVKMVTVGTSCLFREFSLRDKMVDQKKTTFGTKSILDIMIAVAAAPSLPASSTLVVMDIVNMVLIIMVLMAMILALAMILMLMVCNLSTASCST